MKKVSDEAGADAEIAWQSLMKIVSNEWVAYID